MKFLCPGCERLTLFSAFRVEGTSLVLRCSRCGLESRSPASESPAGAPQVASSLALGLKASSAVGLKVVPREPEERIAEQTLDSAEAWSVPAGFCPKCVAVRPPSAATCAQCGLVFANFRPEDFQPSAGMAELWQGLVARWDDLGEHDRVLQAASIQGELATVGRLYRIKLARSADDPIALRGRDEVLRLATASSAALAQTSGEAHSPLPSTWKYVLLALLVACAALVFLLLYNQIRAAS